MDIVIGADGFLGRNLCDYLAEHALPFFAVGKAAGDLRDAETVQGIFAQAPKARRIFHCVTFQRTGAVQYEMQAELLGNNLRLHANVLAAWKECQPQAKLISMGSSCTYPESDAPLPESRFGEGGAHASVRGYAFAKQLIALGSELYAQQYGLSWLHCVLATLYGSHDHKEPDRSHFIGAMLHRAVAEMREGKKQFSLWGTPGVTRECLHVRDQIEAILAADARFSNRILNCAANRKVTVDEVARTITRVIGWDAEPHYLPGSFVGARAKTLDSTAFLTTTGWSPRITLEEGLAKLYAAEYAKP